MRHRHLRLAALVAVLLLASRYSDSAPRERDEGGPWVQLGTRKVDFKGERDVIEIGKEAGRFTAIRLEVQDGDLELFSMKVVFGNGEVFEPADHLEFKEGSRTHAIELPGVPRMISRVEFAYRSEHRREPATVVLYGREGR